MRPATRPRAGRWITRCGKAVDASARPLTSREREVVAKVAVGRRRHEIAGSFITDSTVKTHLRNAMHKLNVRSKAQLAAVALTKGLIDPDQHRACEGRDRRGGLSAERTEEASH